jgi:hypothetical protein
MSRNNAHHASGQSLVGSSGEYHPTSGQAQGRPVIQGRATSNKLDESTAALGRPPTHIDGLTDFLRKEYYRRMGIYLNGGRKEEGLLLNFWKDHVSEAYKNLNE